MIILVFWYKFFNSGRFIDGARNFFIFLVMFGMYTAFALFGLIVSNFHIIDNQKELVIGIICALAMGLVMTYFIFFSDYGIRSRLLKAAETKLRGIDALVAIGATIVYFVVVMMIIGSHKDFYNTIH